MAEFAPGIPARDTRHSIPKIEKPKTWEFGLHRHLAERAKEHFDLRLGDPETGHAHSWALRYFPKPGETRLAVQQPTHTVAYMDFKGTIPSGYGKGEVELARRDKTEIVSSSSGHVRFNVYGGKGTEEYLLRHTDGNDWLLKNITVTRDQYPSLPSSKPSYKTVEPAKLEIEDPNTVLQAKIDGAHVLYNFKKPGSTPDVYSYRPAERETGIIEHTHRLPDYSERRTPAALKDTILRGELYAVDPQGKALPAHRVGGILNANVWKSREKQEQEGKLVPTVFDVVKWKGKDVSDAPFATKLDLLREAVKHAPWLQLPRTAVTTEEKKNLVEDIRHHREPSTIEGVIEWRLDKGIPAKVKFRDEHDVYVRDVFKEEGKRQGMAGGFTYSMTLEGPILGRVGTGMSHALKKDLLEQPDKYKGLKALVKMQPGHVGRAPSFQGFHMEQELPEGIKLAQWSAFLNEMEKVALPRWQKALQTGEISNLDAVQRMGPEAGLTQAPIVGPAFTHNARQKMWEGGTDLSPEQLSQHRNLQQRIGRAQLAAAGGKPVMSPIGPTTFMGDVYAGPTSGTMLRELSEGGVPGAVKAQLHVIPANPALPQGLRDAVSKLPSRAQPVDSSLYRATVEHELGEKALAAGAGTTISGHKPELSVPARAISSHLGGLPHLEEQQAIHRDPEAQNIMHKLRASDPDDAFIRAKMRQYGSTPNAPMPIGGRAHTNLERAIAAHPIENPMAVANRSTAFAQGAGHGMNLPPQNDSVKVTHAVGGALDWLGKKVPGIKDKLAPVQNAFSGSLRAMTAGPVPDPANIGHRILTLRQLARAK